MATLTFTLHHESEEVLDIGLDRFSRAMGWTDTVPDPENPAEEIPNPVSQEDFASTQLFQFVINQIEKYNGRQGAAAGKQQAIDATRATMGAVQHSIA